MRVIYVDDSEEEIIRFREVAEQIREIRRIDTFRSGSEALEFVKTETIDMAFLDIHMPGLNGISLAKIFSRIQPDMKIVFVSAYTAYILQAFDVNVVGYVVKPYTVWQIQDQIKKITGRRKLVKQKRVFFQTIPHFEIYVDKNLLPIRRKKVKEYLALLVDYAGCTVTGEQAIAYLWEDRPNDEATKALMRMTAKRLRDVLIQKSIADILIEEKGVRAIDTSKVDCDYYMLMAGDRKVLEKYHG